MVDDPGTSSVNLLHVRRMLKVPKPIPVSRLVKIIDGQPLASNRTQGGGHSYVRIGKDYLVPGNHSSLSLNPVVPGESERLIVIGENTLPSSARFEMPDT